MPGYAFLEYKDNITELATALHCGKYEKIKALVNSSFPLGLWKNVECMSTSQ